MKRARNATVNQFVDLEAGVSEVEDQEHSEDEDEYDNFIEDQEDDQDRITWKRFSEIEQEEDSGWGHVVASLEERFNQSRVVSSSVVRGREERPLESHKTMVSTLKNILVTPSCLDTPIWRVRCKLGLEEDIVLFLFQKAAPAHELRAAFMRDSIRGWVYLEATMNAHLGHLLKRTPGVVVGPAGIIIQHIEFEDAISVLRMRDSQKTPQIGKWVEVRRGMYKGDVGYVDCVNSWGVQLFLIPRLPPPEPSYVVHSKRKRSRPHTTPALFDPVIVNQTYGVKPRLLQEDIYTYKGHNFEHGLILKSFQFDSIQTIIPHMPFTTFCLFRESSHPKLIADEGTFPRPLEWDFAQGDEVTVLPKIPTWPTTVRNGVITSVQTDSVEVELATGESSVVVPWIYLRKVLPVGDYVEITGGEYRGRKGWFEGMQNHTGHEVASVIEVEESDKHLSDRVKILETHINLIKSIPTPFVLGSQTPILRHPQSELVPWLKTEIIIAGHHALKSYRGIITDVLCNQNTESGLRVGIQLTSLDSNAPFKQIILDYDDVVQSRCGEKLYDYAPPRNNLFKPLNFASISNKPTLFIQQLPLSIGSAAPGHATPMPKAPFSSSPAWDPNAEFPDTNFDESGLAGPSHLPLSSPPEHILLDPRLLDTQLKVTVTGGMYNKKDLTASITAKDGKAAMLFKSYNSVTILAPEWVTPRWPNPTRDNGLLVVIKGDHCGKYVRRIHHRYEGDKAIVILGVVKRVAGQADTLTEEKLELDVSHLCLSEESKEDKKRNTSLMDAVREEARKIRAK